MATIPLSPDFKDLLRLLRTEGVEYLLVGGYAVSYHGYPRGTADMDIWYAATKENAVRLTSALIKFGFSAESIKPEMLLRVGEIFRIGIAPFRVELLTRLSGVKFEECYPRRVEGIIGGELVSVINQDDLIANKTAAGRPKDKADVEELTRVIAATQKKSKS